MTGWHVLVFRRKAGDPEEPSPSARLAVWQTDFDGLGWLDGLVAEQHATVRGNGYPLDYTTTVGRVRDAILTGPPHALKRWKSEQSASFSENWTGRTVVDRDALAAADASDEVLVRAWDES